MPSSILDTIISPMSYVQRREIITKERFHSIRGYFFQSIGFCVLLYYFFQLPILLYLFLKLLFRFISQIFSTILWLPLKTTELVLPKTDKYYIIVPLFCLCLLLSYSIATFFHKNIRKRHSFILPFIILLLFQSLFILLPISRSIQEQRKLSSTSIDVEQIIMKLSEMSGHGNNKLKEVTKNLSEKRIIDVKNKLSTSDGQDSKVGSDIEDVQNKNKAKNSPNLRAFSSNEEQELLLTQQANNLVDSSQQISSKVLEIKKRKESFIKSIILHHWLNDAWNSWYSTTLDSKEYLSQSNISSIHTAFTDLNCYDYTKILHQYKNNYIYFLNKYRLQSPFPIYLSIIKSNGPKCYPYHPNSSCAIRSKFAFSSLKRQLFRFTRFWMIISIPIIILLFIYKRLWPQQQYNLTIKPLDKTNDLPLQKVSSDTNHPLDKKLENELRLWLAQEENNGYQNISESYRIALNSTFSKEDVSKSGP